MLSSHEMHAGCISGRLAARSLLSAALCLAFVGWSPTDGLGSSSQPFTASALPFATHVTSVARDGSNSAWNIGYDCVYQSDFYGWTVTIRYSGMEPGFIRWVPGWGRIASEDLLEKRYGYNIPPNEDSAWWGATRSATQPTVVQLLDSQQQVRVEIVVPPGVCLFPEA